MRELSSVGVIAAYNWKGERDLGGEGSRSTAHCQLSLFGESVSSLKLSTHLRVRLRGKTYFITSGGWQIWDIQELGGESWLPTEQYIIFIRSVLALLWLIVLQTQPPIKGAVINYLIKLLEVKCPCRNQIYSIRL